MFWMTSYILHFNGRCTNDYHMGHRDASFRLTFTHFELKTTFWTKIHVKVCYSLYWIKEKLILLGICQYFLKNHFDYLKYCNSISLRILQSLDRSHLPVHFTLNSAQIKALLKANSQWTRKQRDNHVHDNTLWGLNIPLRQLTISI